MAWTSPSLQLRWGPYFRPDPEEQNKVVGMVRGALAGDGGALITKRHAVEKIAAIFEIENVDAALEAIEDEEAKQQEAALERTSAEAAALHGAVNRDDGGSGTGGAEPPKNAGGRGRVPVAPAAPKG